MNILVQLFKPTLGPGGPVDAARGEFNNFIRGTTIGIVVVMTFLVGGIASEVLGVERMKETWTSLLATPMTGRGDRPLGDPGDGLADRAGASGP